MKIMQWVFLIGLGMGLLMGCEKKENPPKPADTTQQQAQDAATQAGQAAQDAATQAGQAAQDAAQKAGEAIKDATQ